MHISYNHPIFSSAGILQVLNELDTIPFCVIEVFHVDLAIRALLASRGNDRLIIRGLIAVEAQVLSEVLRIELSEREHRILELAQDRAACSGPLTDRKTMLDHVYGACSRIMERMFFCS